MSRSWHRIPKPRDNVVSISWQHFPTPSACRNDAHLTSVSHKPINPGQLRALIRTEKNRSSSKQFAFARVIERFGTIISNETICRLKRREEVREVRGTWISAGCAVVSGGTQRRMHSDVRLKALLQKRRTSLKVSTGRMGKDPISTCSSSSCVSFSGWVVSVSSSDPGSCSHLNFFADRMSSGPKSDDV